MEEQFTFFFFFFNEPFSFPPPNKGHICVFPSYPYPMLNILHRSPPQKVISVLKKRLMFSHMSQLSIFSLSFMNQVYPNGYVRTIHDLRYYHLFSVSH